MPNSNPTSPTRKGEAMSLEIRGGKLVLSDLILEDFKVRELGYGDNCTHLKLATLTDDERTTLLSLDMPVHIDIIIKSIPEDITPLVHLASGGAPGARVKGLPARKKLTISPKYAVIEKQPHPEGGD